MKRILLCRTDAVGDLLLTLPVARSIKEQNPDLFVALLVSRYTAPLLSAEPYLDEIVAIPGRGFKDFGQTAAFARDLKKLKFDAILYFYPRLSLAFAGWRANIPLRIGTGRRAYSFLFNRRIKLHRRDSGKHELDLNYELASSTFPHLTAHDPSLVVTEAELAAARALLHKYNVSEDHDWIIVHPRSHGSSPNWSLKRYRELSVKLVERGFRVVVTGSALEADLIQEEFDKSNDHIINLAGSTLLPELKGLIRLAPLLISGSTGPIHIAAAVGTPTVGIYPPQSALSQTRWGPRGGMSKIFTPPEATGKNDVVKAMDQISVDDVVRYVSAIVSNTNA
jgi:ADP-heptose:LPS heptosyltransferase